MSNFIVTRGLGGLLHATKGWGASPADAPTEPSNIITDMLERSLSLFITQYRQTRVITNGSSSAALSFNSDPAQGGIDVDTENPITDHVSRALSLFITQYRQTRVL